MAEQIKQYEVGGVKFALSEKEGLALSAYLSQMSDIPDLKSMIETDENGMITYFEPREVSWGFVFFVQNLMIMQRLRIIDDFAEKQGLVSDRTSK